MLGERAVRFLGFVSHDRAREPPRMARELMRFVREQSKVLGRCFVLALRQLVLDEGRHLGGADVRDDLFEPRAQLRLEPVERVDLGERGVRVRVAMWRIERGEELVELLVAGLGRRRRF